MRRQTQISVLRCSLFYTALMASLPGHAAGNESPELPDWQALEYEQQAFFVTAKSRIEINPGGEHGEYWRLAANSSVASNSETVTLRLAADGRALSRTRLSQGKGRRYKTFTFLPDHILRVRHDPADAADTPPCEWPVTGRREIPYPPIPAGAVVTDAYALLALADRFIASAATSAQFVVHTEFNFYSVRMTRSESPTIEADIKVSGAPDISGSRPTRAVAIRVDPLGEQPDKPDFSLLGLSGDIVVLFDVASGLPLQLRGTAPRIGNTEINLRAATLRHPPS